jgi:hypothetical protein
MGSIDVSLKNTILFDFFQVMASEEFWSMDFLISLCHLIQIFCNSIFS